MAFGTGSLLFTSRLPFALGLAFGLAALLALQRRRRKLAFAMAVLCPLGSPVAGLFLSMAGLTYAIAAGGLQAHAKRVDGVAMALAAFIPPVFLAVAFPEGGWAPFPFSAYLPIPIFVVASLLLLPKPPARAALWRGHLRHRIHRGAAVRDAHGRQRRCASARCFGGPLLLCALWGRRLPGGRPAWVAVGVLFAGLAVWQWSAPVRDVVKYLEDPAAKADYFDGLREFLAGLPDQRRIEIPFTRSHWEGAEIAPNTKLARGWLRQLDTGHHPIFYRGQLTELTYAELAGRERGALRGAAERHSRQAAPTRSGR